MALRIFQVVSIVLLALVGGLYWGPWLAVTRSMSTFEAPVFLALVQRMNRNMGPLMTVLMPVALASTVPVLVLSYGNRPETFGLTVAALALFVLTLMVTVAVEVPIVQRMATWTPATMPDDWQQQRDRWGSFHLLRVLPAAAGLVLLVVGALF
jgi:uncharacterized membrane protein